MRVNPLFESFNAGELSPWLLARLNFDKYAHGVETCENLIALVEGPVERRPGTRFITRVHDSARHSRLIPFRFSVEQAYIIEFAHLRLRFFRHQGIILNVGGTAPYELASPYGESDLNGLGFTQSADVLFVLHNNHPPRKLVRLTHNNWIFEDFARSDGPYSDTNLTNTTLTPSAVTGNITITASAPVGINRGRGFLATDVGRLIRLNNRTVGNIAGWGFATITAVTSTTLVSATVNRNFQSVGATTIWRLGAWSNTTGFPSSGTFIQNRLLLAGSIQYPQMLVLSQSGSFENFSGDSPEPAETPERFAGLVTPSDAIIITLAADEVNAILWVQNLRKVVIGTTGGVWSLDSPGGVLTPRDVSARQDTKTGSANIGSIVAGNRVIYLQRGTKKVIEVGFHGEARGLDDIELTRLARHITDGGITRLAYQEEPHRIVWFIRADGTLLAMTYNRQEDVVGWSRCITDGMFEDVAVIEGADGAGQFHSSAQRDEVWVVVRRMVGGAFIRCIEVFERGYLSGQAQRDAYYVDSLITYRGVSTTSISGLGHLEGRRVSIWGNGAVMVDAIVVNGTITLESPVSVAQIGLPYRHRLRTLKLNVGGRAGTSLGRLKRINALVFFLLNSHTMHYGPSVDRMTGIGFRRVSSLMDVGVPLFSGEWEVDFESSWDTDARLIIESSDPAPFTLLAIGAEVTQHELK